MSTLQGKNILVTGASGFTGSCLAEYLIENGANVTTILAHWKKDTYYINSGLINKINNIIGDLTDSNFIDGIIKDNAISAVFHLAGFSVEKLAFSFPKTTFETNVRGTYNLLEACRNNMHLIKQVVIASSDKAYGNSKILPYTEDMPLKGLHPYDCSKSCQDLIAQAYAHSYNLPIAIGRFGNIYGRGDFNWSRLIPGTIRRLYNGEPPIVRMPLSDDFKRDFLYISDLIRAYIAMYNYLELHNVYGQAFNFAMGGSWTVLEVVNKLRTIMNRRDIEPIFVATDHGEILHQQLSTDKAAQLLNWSSQYNLEQGLCETVQWYRAYLEKETSLENNFCDLIEKQIKMQ